MEVPNFDQFLVINHSKIVQLWLVINWKFVAVLICPTKSFSQANQPAYCKIWTMKKHCWACTFSKNNCITYVIEQLPAG